MKNIAEIIADNLIMLRKKHNLTQNDLAEKLKYSDNTVSRWEHAEITPTIETLQKISEIYDVPLEYLFKENITENISKDNRIEKLNDVIDFEIAYYEYGNDTTPSGPFEYRGFSCRTNVGKILYCVSYFVEDVFGLTLKSEQKYQIINDIADIILDLKI